MLFSLQVTMNGGNLAEEEDDLVEDVLDSRFLEVCIDGDVEDLVVLLEDMAKHGEMLTPDLINLPDASGRVSEPFLRLPCFN